MLRGFCFIYIFGTKPIAMKKLLLLLLFCTTATFSQINLQPILPYAYCGQNGYAIFSLSNLNPMILNGLNPQLYSIAYYETQADAQDGNNNVISAPAQYTNIVPYQQLLYVRVWENANPANFDTEQLLLLVEDNPPSISATPMALCGNFTGSATFNLLSKGPELTMGNPNFTVTYHITAEANFGDQVANPSAYTITTSPKTIYARVSNGVTGCSSVSTFNLIVQPAPIAPVLPAITSCSGTYNLTLNNALHSSGATLSFYTSANSALDNTNPITNPTNYTTVPGTVYVRSSLGTNPECFSIVQQNLSLNSMLEGFNIMINGNTVTVQGPIGEYMYSIDNSVQQSGNEFENVTEGSHTLTIYDNCGNIRIIMFSVTLGTTENVFKSLKSYPNPAQNIFIISNNTIIDKVEIYSLTGQLVKSENINTETAALNIADLQDGIYMVKVSSGNAEKTIKMVKQ